MRPKMSSWPDLSDSVMGDCLDRMSRKCDFDSIWFAAVSILEEHNLWKMIPVWCVHLPSPPLRLLLSAAERVKKD